MLHGLWLFFDRGCYTGVMEVLYTSETVAHKAIFQLEKQTFRLFLDLYGVFKTTVLTLLKIPLQYRSVVSR